MSFKLVKLENCAQVLIPTIQRSLETGEGSGGGVCWKTWKKGLDSSSLEKGDFISLVVSQSYKEDTPSTKQLQPGLSSFHLSLLPVSGKAATHLFFPSP